MVRASDPRQVQVPSLSPKSQPFVRDAETNTIRPSHINTMSPRKRDRGTLSSSPQSHTDKRPRIKEDDTGKRSSQSEGEAPMDLASSSDSEPDTITTVRPFSNSLTHQRPAPAPESETSETDSTTASTTDDDSDDNDETEGDRDSEENTGVVSWGWGDAHFQYELDPVRAVGQDQEQDTPYSDPRIPLWQQEDRIFADDILKEYPEIASLVAVSESHGPLEIDGVPQLSLFCDGSMKDSNFEGWKMGGYSVAFRDPFFGTGDSVSQADPARFLAKQAVREHLQVSSFQQQEENESREGLAQVADFTILEYATQALSVGHVELGAISQCLEVGIMLQDEHQRDSMKIRVFTDSAAAVERLEFGILPLDSDEGSFFRWSTNPLVRTIVWQSHYLTSVAAQLKSVGTLVAVPWVQLLLMRQPLRGSPWEEADFARQICLLMPEMGYWTSCTSGPKM